LDRESFGRRAVHFVFFAMPLGSVWYGYGPATALFRDRLHAGLWPSGLLYVAAAVGAVFIFGKIASKIEERLFADHVDRQGTEVSA
jgi:hypothetical protein